MDRERERPWPDQTTVWNGTGGRSAAVERELFLDHAIDFGRDALLPARHGGRVIDDEQDIDRFGRSVLHTELAFLKRADEAEVVGSGITRCERQAEEHAAFSSVAAWSKGWAGKS